MINLMHGDCLELMKDIPDGSVDLVLTDPPYGTVKGIGGDSVSHGMSGKTDWDCVINEEKMFSELDRITRVKGKIILFSQEPYTYSLIFNAPSNMPLLYRMIWEKDHFANALTAKKAPLNYFEDICVFEKKYIKQRGYEQNNEAFIYLRDQRVESGISMKDINELSSEYQGKTRNKHRNVIARSFETSQFMMPTKDLYENVLQKTGYFKISYQELVDLNNKYKYESVFNLQDGSKFKSNILKYKKDYNGLHPTQKPLALMEDLVFTYSNENDVVLDFTMGSGTTGVACKNLNRKFIGIEKDDKYFEIAKERIENHIPPLVF